MISARDTQSRILDAAEYLFGEQGLERVSIRDITERAKVNVAAINYHFGSKNDLIAAVLERRLQPLNAARLQMLAEVEQKACSRGAPVEQIVQALVLPTIGCCVGDSGALAKLTARCITESGPEIEAFLMKHFEPVASRFENAFLKALPELSRSDVYWRMKFAFGALHHWLLTRDRFIPAWAEKASLDNQVRKLIAFISAGFRTDKIV
jgi:AcrR family transcriptional regulator